MGFGPAMSTKAKKAKGQQIRAWHLNRRRGTNLSGLAEDINPQVRGWINYYGRFYRSELYFLARRIDEHIVEWAMQKFKRLRGKPERSWDWLAQARQRHPNRFAHWQLARHTQAGLWEPYDGRPSRTVLQEREGETPSRHSPDAGPLAKRATRREARETPGPACGTTRHTEQPAAYLTGVS